MSGLSRWLNNTERRNRPVIQAIAKVVLIGAATGATKDQVLIETAKVILHETQRRENSMNQGSYTWKGALRRFGWIVLYSGISAGAAWLGSIIGLIDWGSQGPFIIALGTPLLAAVTKFASEKAKEESEKPPQ